MFAILESFFVEYGYAAVFFVLVICGFGVPIPEDLTLVTGGVISGLGYTNSHIMFAVGMLGVLVGDGFMFAAGRIWGQKILKFKPIARVMTPKRYAQVQEKFDKVLGIGAVIVGWIWWRKHRRHTFFREKLHEKRAAKAKKQTNQ